MKPIAERFRKEWADGSADVDTSEMNGVLFVQLLDWLKKQPENSKTFTLAEVEAIAREAYWVSNDGSTIFQSWWQSKLKEWGKV